jgi:beta-glucosidase
MTTQEKIGQLMMDAPAIPRLGVPAYHWWNEALHGVARAGAATVFPQAIGLAATWDTDLMHRVATTISVEARAKHHEALRQGQHGIYQGLTLWSPNVNIFRDPRWGRGHETYGEDPFLTGRMGVAFVTGIQGDDRDYLRAVATPKHFAVHSGPEPLRHAFDAKTPERDVFETYLPAFEACVREGHAQSAMAAYSAFNGVPATGNPWLLTDLLRKTWGFDGAVVSDVDSVHDLWAGHHVAKDTAEASAMALKAGDDLCSGGTYRALPEALRRGLITEADLDRAATRLFTLRYRLGMFDGPDKVRYQRIPISENDTPAHDALALEAARKSLVLLKNDGVLPLRARSLKRVAVIGPVGDSLEVLLGNYNGTPTHPVTIAQGIRRMLEPLGVRVDVAQGTGLAKGLTEGQQPLPKGTLFTDASRSMPGLKREVFAGRELAGTPLGTSIDERVDLRWEPDAPIAGIPGQNCSIRWTGVFVPPTSGETVLGTSADDGVRLWVDDKLVIDDWNQNAERARTAKVRVTAGQAVKLRLEFFQAGGGAAIRLGWADPDLDRHRMEEALNLARHADVTVLTLGITPSLEGEEMRVNAEGFLGGDRTSIDLPQPQRDLLRRVSALGKPVVVVLTGGSAQSLDVRQAGAVLLQWYSGQRGGDAVADVLLGRYNPAGRLPVTFYQSVNDLPPFEDYAMAGRTYRYFGGHPLFPFGYGLSFTKFRYGVAKASLAGRRIRLSVPVSNVGSMSGEEVVQVYVRPTKRQPNDALRSLAAFQRVSIGRGQTRSVELLMPMERLRVWDPQRKAYVVRKGEYEVEVGASSSDIRARAQIRVR